VSPSKKRIAVTTTADIPDGEARVFQIGEDYIAICHVGEQFYAVEDRCTHDDGPLGEGAIDGYEIECPRHGARFDIRDGSVCRMPAYGPIRRFEVVVENGFVFIDWEPGS